MFSAHKSHQKLRNSISGGCSSLEDLLPGEQARVVDLQGSRHLVSRMAAMGFTPGAEVSLIQNSGQGPLIASVRGARIAIGRGEARKILVLLLERNEPGP